MAMTTSHYTPKMPDFDAPLKLLLVVSPYYPNVTDNLLNGAKEALNEIGAAFGTVEVPGALEIPTAISIAHRDSNYDGYVALGCVIRGETTHYDIVCEQSARGLMQLGLSGLCIGNGILTVENMVQATTRGDVQDQNKGRGAAVAALHLVALSRKWGRQSRGAGFKPASEHILMAGRHDTEPKIV